MAINMVIPSVLFCLLVLVGLGSAQSTPPNPPSSVFIQQATETFDDHPNLDVENVTIDDELDYLAIRQFITRYYAKTSASDTELIARRLVQYGKEHQVDPKLIAALMARESSFNREAVSVTGAKGLGQIKDFNFDSLHITDPFDIDQNTKGTVTYMKRMLTRWRDDSKRVSLALASYFKGHNAIARSDKRVDSTTKRYVRDILTHYQTLLALRGTLAYRP